MISPTFYRQLYGRALQLVVNYHGDQTYGDLPYIFHLMEVDAEVCRKYGHFEWKKRIIAILHDIVEDTSMTCESLMYDHGFPLDVVEAVDALSKRKGEDYREYMGRVLKVELALQVKICDTVVNLKNSIKEERQKGVIKYTRQLSILSKGVYDE